MCSKLTTLCGILGIWAKNKEAEADFNNIPAALSKLKHRGPDNQTYKIYSNVALAHARLSIIDLSSAANQPYPDSTGRYHLVFNGEIYNYKLLRENLKQSGIVFKTESDTEVLLQLLIQKGINALNELHGFFAFIFYDSLLNEMFVARDRMGIKPLLYYHDDHKFIFGSELSVFNEFTIDKKIDSQALNEYFSLTYIPAPRTIFSKVKKVLPGEYLHIKDNQLTSTKYFTIEKKEAFIGSYDVAQKQVKTLLNKSVERRLIADVPIGSFLSGGLDSSIIALLAKKQKENLHTFSIGFDHPYFNESAYAEMMAKHIGTKHETIVLTKTEFRKNFQFFLDSIDEPFADSSSFAVYLLSQKTKNDVSVCLSGDGADELFGGYRKHLAEMKIRSMGGLKKAGVNAFSNLFKSSTVSRSQRWGDFNRKIQKFASGTKMNSNQRYDSWCKWIKDDDRIKLLKGKNNIIILGSESEIKDMNDFLIRDQQFVLPNDMLKKVDQMSMAHALEVRVPFLDHELVEFANSLPSEFKVTTRTTKKILRDCYSNELPNEIINRSKKGFEIPLEEWLSDEISEIVSGKLFTEKYLNQQGLFDYQFIQELISNWKNKRIGEQIYIVWALIVFQNWYHKNVQND